MSDFQIKATLFKVAKELLNSSSHPVKCKSLPAVKTIADHIKMRVAPMKDDTEAGGRCAIIHDTLNLLGFSSLPFHLVSFWLDLRTVEPEGGEPCMGRNRRVKVPS